MYVCMYLYICVYVCMYVSGWIFKKVVDSYKSSVPKRAGHENKEGKNEDP